MQSSSRFSPLADLPRGGPVEVRMDRIAGQKVAARWYDPRKGEWREIGEYPSTGTREFAAPSRGDLEDWVLVIEDAGKGYPLHESR